MKEAGVELSVPFIVGIILMEIIKSLLFFLSEMERGGNKDQRTVCALKIGSVSVFMVMTGLCSAAKRTKLSIFFILIQ